MFRRNVWKLTGKLKFFLLQETNKQLLTRKLNVSRYSLLCFDKILRNDENRIDRNMWWNNSRYQNFLILNND